MSTTQNILVTGSSSGFGYLTTLTLLGKGHTVFATMRGLTDKNAAVAQMLREEAATTPGTIHLLELDVTNDNAVNKAVAQALETESHLDVVVNNAGFGVGGYMETVTPEQLHRQFDVNLYGVQRIMRAVLPSMRRRGKGLVIGISSIMGRIVIPFSGVYTASKFALEGLMESYRYELSGTGVDVVLVEPGGFGTSFRENMQVGTDTRRLQSYGSLADLPEQLWSGFLDKLKSEKAPNPREVARAVLQLIQTPAGQRPLRTVVDPLTGGEAPETINRTTDQLQARLLEGMGLRELLELNTDRDA